MVDEWGTWWDVEPGLIQVPLSTEHYEDAFVAGITLNISIDMPNGLRWQISHSL